MSSFLKKILPSVGIGVGAAVLGSALFPETTYSLTGGLFGNAGASAGLVDADQSGLLGLFGGGGAGGAAATSIWQDPTVLSSGIIAGTSLLSGLFGPQAGDLTEGDKARLAEEQRQFDATMALKEKDLQQALEIAKIQAGAAGAGAGAAVASARIASDSARRQAKASMINDSVTTKAKALELPLAARNNQAERAQTTGYQSGIFFNTLIPSLQRPLLRSNA